MNKKKVLVVDDDENMNAVLMEKLNFSGFEAQGAFDGEEGLKRALEWHPDIILLDLMLPKMTGMDVLSKLREDAWGKGVKVIMLTAVENAKLVSAAMERGAFTYLVKIEHSLDDIVKKITDELTK